MSLFLPTEGKWYPEDSLSVGAMLYHDGLIWLQDGTGTVWTSSSDGRVGVGGFTEETVVGPVKASMTLAPDRPDEPSRVRLTGLWIRATGKGSGTLKVYAAYADGAARADATRKEEVLLGEFSSSMTDRLLTVPLLAGLCDAVTLRLETAGEWVIHDVIRRYEMAES